MRRTFSHEDEDCYEGDDFYEEDHYDDDAEYYEEYDETEETAEGQDGLDTQEDTEAALAVAQRNFAQARQALRDARTSRGFFGDRPPSCAEGRQRRQARQAGPRHAKRPWQVPTLGRLPARGQGA